MTYWVYKKGISSFIQGQFYFGRTHLSEYISAAWQCVGWTISTMKYKVYFSLTSSSLLKREKRKHELSNRKVEKKVWKMICRHFRSRWESILAVSWNHWGVTEEKDAWMDGTLNVSRLMILFSLLWWGVLFVRFFCLFLWVWGFLVCFLGFGLGVFCSFVF